MPITRPKERRVTDSELHVRFAPLCRQWYVKQSEPIDRLATELGVASWALDKLKVGYDGTAWTVPERNHLGQIIGVTRRCGDGKKICVVGSRRGLTFADDWQDGEGPVLIVEGASDVAAGLTMGLSVIGRPSNTGGVNYLTRLLGKEKRRVVILAENDRKPHDTLSERIRERHDPTCKGCAACWPGKWGAVQTSLKLSRQLNRIVAWRLVPDEAKDLRAWLTKRRSAGDEEKVIDKLRRLLLWRLDHQ